MRGVYEVNGWVSRVDDGSRREWRYTIEADSLDDAMSRVVGSSWKPPLVLPTTPEAALREAADWLDSPPEWVESIRQSKAMKATTETCDYIASELRRRANEIEAAR